MLQSIVSFLRAGYPDGVPPQDYIPLLALLSRQLASDEVEDVVDELAAAGDPATADAIRQAIHSVTKAEPLESDLRRVNARLAAAGWPLAPPQ
jgi:hypothetical protein